MNLIVCAIDASLVWQIAFWVALALILSGIFMWFLTVFVASYCIYNATLRRKSKDKSKWSREPIGLEGQSLLMDEEGMRWHSANVEHKKDIHIVNGGLNLYGEFYDFGYDRAVIILSGRTESLRYGYFFARPYAESGFNVIVLDPRAHGLSDGEFNTVGFEESRDALAWTRFARDTLGMRTIVYHGICIGAAAGMLALTSGECPECVKGIVTEGMFPNFGESMKNHLIERKKPIFMIYRATDNWMKHYTGHSMDYGPIDVIARLDRPLLMLHSKEDLYSTPEYAERLFELAGTEKKRIVWFEHGSHSMLRITDTELYDYSIKQFLSKYVMPSIR